MGILSIFKGRNILYYPGCLTKFVLKSELENYKKILEKIKIDYITLPQELCCGSPAINAGYETDARKLALKNFEIFNQHSIKRIITNCPACFNILSLYSEMLLGWDIKVEHITKAILNYMKKRPDKINRVNEEMKTEEMRTDGEELASVTYHDPCHLGRYSGIYEEPREILRLIGYNPIEMKNSKEESLCCGGGAGLKTNNPLLANRLASKIIKQARQVRAKKIITTCPLCFSNISENSDIEVEEFSYIVAKALNIQAEKTDIKSFIKETNKRKEEKRKNER